MGVIDSLFSFLGTQSANETNRAVASANNRTSINIANANNELQERLNSTNNKFAHDEATIANERDLAKMYLQHQLNSPMEMVRLYREAGLNPAVMMQGQSATATNIGSGSPMASPHGSGITPSMPNLVSPHMQAPQFSFGLADSFLKLAQAKQAGAETKRLELSLDTYLDTMDEELRKLKIDNDLQSTFGEQLYDANIQKILREGEAQLAAAYKYAQEGDTEASKRALNAAFKEYYSSASSVNYAQRDLYLKNVANYDKMTTAKIDQMLSDSMKNRATASVAPSQINLNNASAKDILDTLPTDIELAKSETDLNKSRSEYTRDNIKTNAQIRKKLAEEILLTQAQRLGQEMDNERLERLLPHMVRKMEAEARSAEWEASSTYRWTQLLTGVIGAVANPATRMVGRSINTTYEDPYGRQSKSSTRITRP